MFTVKTQPNTFTVKKAVRCERCRKWINVGETAQYVRKTDQRFTVKVDRMVVRHLGTYDWDTGTCR